MQEYVQRVSMKDVKVVILRGSPDPWEDPKSRAPKGCPILTTIASFFRNPPKDVLFGSSQGSGEGAITQHRLRDLAHPDVEPARNPKP